MRDGGGANLGANQFTAGAATLVAPSLYAHLLDIENMEGLVSDVIDAKSTPFRKTVELIDRAGLTLHLALTSQLGEKN